MYSETTIETLAGRLGFGAPIEEGFSIELDEANLVGSTGRFVRSFHGLVTVENIFAALPDLDAEAEEKFNSYLESLRYQATKEVLPLIMDKNAAYDNAKSYDEIILNNAVLFDDAIGYKIAMMALELFMTTKESNLAERNAKLSMGNLKLELEGFRNESNVLVARGIVQKFESAIKSASKKLFPVVPIVQSGTNW